MAARIDEGQIDFPGNNRSETLPDVTPTHTAKETYVANQDTEIMEVHKHPHHVTHKKKWGEYLSEFMMLFLAVFCGFMSENQRESMAEHQREKQFAHQLLADIRTDSATYSNFSIRLNKMSIKYRSFIKLMALSKPQTDLIIITNALPLYWSYSVNATTATYSQMKASGSLRSIRNQSLIDTMQKYYEVSLPRLLMVINDHRQFFMNYLEPFFLNHFELSDMDVNNDTLYNKNTLYRNRTAFSDFQLRNMMASYVQDIEMIVNNFIMPNINKANELILLLQKEYHLPNK